MQLPIWMSQTKSLMSKDSRRTRNTQNFPVEVWERIAFYACTDGGHIGRVLSLVCRNASMGTRRWALNIAAVSSSTALRSLLRTVRTQKHNFSIHHLLIHVENPLYTQLLSELVGYASSHIHTLVILVDHRIDISELLLPSSITFPHLHTLSLAASVMALFPMQPAPRSASARPASTQSPSHILPIFPVLVVLHISFDLQESQANVQSMATRIVVFTRPRHSPRLMHLTVSSVPRIGNSVDALCSILKSTRAYGAYHLLDPRVYDVTIVLKLRRPFNPHIGKGLVDRAREWAPTYRGMIFAIIPLGFRMLNITDIRDRFQSACEDYERHLSPNMLPRRVTIIDPDEPIASSLPEDVHPSHVLGSSGVAQVGTLGKQKPGTSNIWPDMTALRCDFHVWKERFLQDAMADRC
jgi:hypothetical protein